MLHLFQKIMQTKQPASQPSVIQRQQPQPKPAMQAYAHQQQARMTNIPQPSSSSKQVCIQSHDSPLYQEI